MEELQFTYLIGASASANAIPMVSDFVSSVGVPANRLIFWKYFLTHFFIL